MTGFLLAAQRSPSIVKGHLVCIKNNEVIYDGRIADAHGKLTQDQTNGGVVLLHPEDWEDLRRFMKNLEAAEADRRH